MKISNIFKNLEIYNKKNLEIKKVNNENSSNDSFIISEKAKDFNNIFKEVNKCPDIREDKVNIIINKISKGTYNVTSEEIANKILNENI